MTPVASGHILAHKYRLEVLIGRGGMGSVWRAEHLGLNAPVAVKLLDAGGSALTPELLQRFYREARAAANIRSPHVVQILDHGVDELLGVPFIVMELMEGETLAQRLARAGRLDLADVAHVLTHVARALARAHEAGIVHRDLKPDNVFLVRNEDEVVAKVLDFGIAKAQAHALDKEGATRTGAVMGTAYYMSPEQISGTRDVDLSTDLWAFGVVACECLTGRRPFDAETIGGLALKICAEPVPAPSSLGPVPSGFDQWFFRIVNRDPTRRFTSAREAADALRLILAGQPGRAQPTAVSAFGTPIPTLVAPASTLTTSPPISVTSDRSRARERASARRPLLWLGGGLALSALAGALWLRHGGMSGDRRSAASSVLPAASAPSTALPEPTAAGTAAASAAGIAPVVTLAPRDPEVFAVGGPADSAPSAGSALPPPQPGSPPVTKRPPSSLTAPRPTRTPTVSPTADSAKAPPAVKKGTVPPRDVIDDRR